MDQFSGFDDDSQQIIPPDGESAGAKPWASGRVLSKAQRERKREVDRISKAKRRRDNTESRDTVDYLKKQVEELSLKVRTLEREDWQRHQPEEATARQLHHDFPVYEYPFQQEPAASSSNAPFTSTAPATTGFYHSTLDALQTVDPFAPESQTYDQPPSHAADERDLLPPEKAPLLPGEVAATSPPTTESADAPLIKDMFSMLAHEALAAVTPSTRHLVITDPVATQDAVIRGVLQGWPSVVDFSSNTIASNLGSSSTLLRCPVLRAVSKVDGMIFGFSSVSTRLISLRLIHLMLLYATACIPISEIPPWYRPRPSQQRFSHDLAIDLLPWPGLRERAIFESDLIKQNHLWRSIISLFSFNWPYAQELAVVQLPPDGSSPDSGPTAISMSRAMLPTSAPNSRYIFSDAYNAQMWDIRMWNISLEFFEDFPQLFDDIVPKAYVAPMYLRPSGSSISTSSSPTIAGLTDGAGIISTPNRRWDRTSQQRIHAKSAGTKRRRQKGTNANTAAKMPSSSGPYQNPSPPLSAATTDSSGGSFDVDLDNQTMNDDPIDRIMMRTHNRIGTNR